MPPTVNSASTWEPARATTGSDHEIRAIKRAPRNTAGVPRSRMSGHAALTPFARLLCCAQAQRVEDHEHRRARHRGARQHGGEEPSDRERHHQHVVEERPEQVFLDDA